MKRVFTLLLLLCVIMPAMAQVAHNKYWVQFTDKNGSPYSIDNPGEYLSERALERRQAYGISIDEYDIPVNPSYLEAVAATGATILNPSKWLNGVTVQTSDPSVITAIEALSFVEGTRGCFDDPYKQVIKEKTFFAEEFLRPIDNDVKSINDYYGYAYPQISQLNGIELHNLGYRGEGMLIGVCDGGFDGADTHDAFKQIIDDGRLLGTYNFVDKNTNVWHSSTHGTNVWGLMGGNVPDTYVGTAPMATYFLCMTEDVDSENVIEEYNWVSAMELLDSLGVDVVNTSLGYITFDMPQWDHTYIDLDGKTAVITIGSEIACSRGILCVSSAGNEGGTSFPYISVPADGEQTFTIGAVGANGQRAYFSSIGPTYDGRIKPDVMAHGYGTSVPSYGNSYYEGSGTSFSSPVMAGMVACLWQARKDKSPDVIRDIIRQSANRVDNPDNEYGYGIPDMMLALDLLAQEEIVVKDQNSMISVYPNPSNGDVNVAINTSENVVVRIYNQLGQVIYVFDSHKDNVYMLEHALSTIGEGVYLLNIIDEISSQTIKYVKY